MSDRAASPAAAAAVAAAAEPARSRSPADPAPAPEPEDVFSNLDPALHPATLNSVSSEAENPLESFAQHVLGDSGEAEDAALMPFGEDNTLFTPTGEARFGRLGGDADAPEKERGAEDAHGAHDHAHGAHDHAHEHAPAPEGEFSFDGADHFETAAAVAAVTTEADGDVKMGRIVGRNKRRREGEEIVVGPVENGEPIDPIKMKKDSHKEVERRRRENINDGINEIARLIPGGQDKVGKGQLLRRAAEHLAQVKDRLQRVDQELAQKDHEKSLIKAELEQAQRQLDEEHARSMRFETSWREAEDRAAASQFELDRLKTELEELKKQHAEPAEPAPAAEAATEAAAE